jgi:hypothetical protein
MTTMTTDRLAADVVRLLEDAVASGVAADDARGVAFGVAVRLALDAGASPDDLCKTIREIALVLRPELQA